MLRDLPWLPAPRPTFRDDLRRLQAELAGGMGGDFHSA